MTTNYLGRNTTVANATFANPKASNANANTTTTTTYDWC